MNPLLIRRRGMMAKEAVLPDGQLEWIETDGQCYFDTGITNQSRSMEGKFLVTQGNHKDCMLGTDTSDGNDGSLKYMLLDFPVSSTYFRVAFSYYYYYNSGMPNILNSVTNKTPFEVKSQAMSGSQKINVKQQGEGQYTTASKTGSGSIISANMFLLAANRGGNAVSIMNEGTRIYYTKIYSNFNYTGLVRDYLPWRLNGVVGLWDNVSQTFFAPQGGTLTGGPNVI